MRVQELVRRYEVVWWDSRNAGFGLSQIYTYHEKFIRETAFNQFLTVLDIELTNSPTDAQAAKAKKGRLRLSLWRYVENGAGFQCGTG